MFRTRGLPIAAYLGMLVALALAAAFIAVLGIVIFLPPRPPDVMRVDTVADHFEAGYDHMVSIGRPLSESGMVWSLRDEPPEGDDSPYMRATQRELAHRLDVEKDQVVMYAAHVERSMGFVFRVQPGDLEELTREAERVARQAERDHDRAVREAERIAEEAERQSELASAAAERQAEATTHAAQELARQAEERARLAEEMARERAAEAEARAQEAEERMREASERVSEVLRRLEEQNPDFDVDVDVDSEGNIHVMDAEELGRHIELHNEAIPVPPAGPVTPMAPPNRATPATPPNRAQRPDAPTPPTPPEPPAPMFAPAPAGVVLVKGFEVGAQLPDGRWLVMSQGRNWAEIGWILRAALVIAGALAVLSVLAVLFARRLTRPIRNFSDAVQAVGVDPQSEPVVEEGPLELRGAARAVNTMQARLRALIADRTKTLAAVAHDMRTPLMRLRLAAEHAPVEQRERMAKEIGEVEALVASFIAFARDDPAEEARVRIDLSALLQSIADDHIEARRSVTFEGDERFIVTGQPLGLKRLFANLVENALKYAGGARIKVRRDDGVVIVDVGDDGPGIPAAQRETVFEPFVRLSDGAGGAGLGLPAARSIARAHGGDIAIIDAEKGALLRVTLPA
jgi:signal transduction histidine kinase